MTEPEKTPFKRWYEVHGGTLAEKRRQKYANDPAYRELAKKRAEDYRKRKKAERPERPAKYSLTFTEAAEALGISRSVLRDLRVRELYPEPYQHGRQFYFTPDQVELLKPLVDHWKTLGRSQSPEQKEATEDLSSVVFANWE